MRTELDYPIRQKYFKHLWWALILPAYLIFYQICEHIVVDTYWVSYMPVDDLIPFCEWFVPFYVSWYPSLLAMGLYLAWRNTGDFRRFALFILVGFFSALIFCLIFPNGQDLRPEVFPRDNVLTRLMGVLYAADTNTNVLPSMHVIGSFGLIFASYDSRALRHKTWLHVVTIALTVLICAATVFVKQHSLLDTLVGIPWSFAVWAVVYLPGRKKRRAAEAVQDAAEP